jgi:hypothetical protein
MIVVVHIVLLAGIFVWLWKKFPQPIFSIALLLKITSGICLGLLYRHYYTTGDTWSFFTDAKNATSILRMNPNELINFFWFDDWALVGQPMITSGMNAMFMLKWVTFFNLITGDNYWLVAVYFSILSFVGSWILFKSLCACYPDIKVEAAIAVLFVPSIVFWSSGVIKECLALGALFALSGIFIQWNKQSVWNRTGVVVTLISLWILWYLKYYWLGVWLAAMGSVSAMKILSNKNEWISRHRVLMWVIFFMVAVVSVSILHPNFYYYRILSVVVENYQAYIKISSPEDVIVFASLEPTLVSVGKNVPWAVISAFFRPFIWEALTAFQLLAAFENLILFLLFLLSLLRFKKWFVDLNELHLAVLFYVIILAALLALSTPNFGSLSRYRIGFTPFLWLVLLVTAGVGKYLPNAFRNWLDTPLSK